MRFGIFIGLVLVGCKLFAQADSLTYYIVKKDSSAFYCKITGQQPNSLSVIKANGKSDTILNTDIALHYVIDEQGTMRDVKKITRAEWKEIVKGQERIERYKRWESCFIIKKNNDTLWGKVESGKDHTSSQYGKNNFFSRWYIDWAVNKIHFIASDKKEISFRDAEIKQLYVFNRPPEYSYYVSVVDDWDNHKLYRLIVDGKCQLLAAMVKVIDYNDYVINPQNGLPFGGLPFNESYYTEEFFSYYKNTLTHLTPTEFKKNKVFTDCSIIEEKIARKEYTIQKLPEIVTEFNQCLETKK